MIIPLTVDKIKKLEDPTIVKFVEMNNGELRFMEMDLDNLQRCEMLLSKNETREDVKSAGSFIKGSNDYILNKKESLSLGKSVEDSTVEKLESTFESKFRFPRKEPMYEF